MICPRVPLARPCGKGSESNGWGIFDRRNGEISTDVDRPLVRLLNHRSAAGAVVSITPASWRSAARPEGQSAASTARL